MLDALFIKPPILSKKIIETLVVDIADKKNLLIDTLSVERYIESKYLTNLNRTTEVEIFQDLWKFVFRLKNEQAEENRNINYKALAFLYKRNIPDCLVRIKNEKDYFSSIGDSKQTLGYLIRFLAENEFLLPELREDVKLIIEKFILKNYNGKIVSWFLNETFQNHLKEIKDWIQGKGYKIIPPHVSIWAYRRLIIIGFEKGYRDETIDFINWMYAEVTTFDDADLIFSHIINPNLEEFNLEQIKSLCTFANKNSQTYSRRKSESDHKRLKIFIESKIDEDFDFGKYENIFIDIEELAAVNNYRFVKLAVQTMKCPIVQSCCCSSDLLECPPNYVGLEIFN